MIKISSVSKSFDRVKALDDVSMNIKRGAIYGLVGTNGSGKTTLLKHVTGILRQDKGDITVDGMPVYENIPFKERLGFISDDLYFFGNFTLNDMAKMYKGFYPVWDQERFDAIVDTFALNRGLKISRFSKGMQKQAAFALVMSVKPDYLVLDEPVDGLDPLARRTVWDLIVNDVAARQMTVLISSHNLKEIEGICDTVGILSSGRVVLERELDDLKSAVHKVQVALKDKTGSVYDGLDILSKETIGSIDMLIVRDSAENIREVIGKHDPVILDILPLTLEEIFIYELGGENDEFKAILS